MLTYKYSQTTLTSLVSGTNDAIEIQFGESSDILGLRFEIISGTLDSFDLLLENKGDSVLDVFTKVYPFESSDQILINTNLKDVQFIDSIKLVGGDTLKVIIKNLVGLSGVHSLRVSLYYR